MGGSPESEYATSVAESSYNWYRVAAIRARRMYRGSEVSVIVVSALVPVSAVVWSSNVLIPAVLGATIVVISGFRSIFHWHENYLRFSRAREAVAAELRRYRVRVPPYATEADRDSALAEAVTQIEQDEMGTWLQLATARRAQPDR